MGNDLFNRYKLFIIIWNHIKELKRKEIVNGTSDMQWTVSTLRRATIYVSKYRIDFKCTKKIFNVRVSF
jgi:hypothetical protein